MADTLPRRNRVYLLDANLYPGAIAKLDGAPLLVVPPIDHNEGEAWLNLT